MNREAMFYTTMEGRPAMRVEIRSEDTDDGRAGHLHAIGLDAMMETTAAISDAVEGGFKFFVGYMIQGPHGIPCPVGCTLGTVYVRSSQGIKYRLVLRK